jgi:hypothetical protein
MMDKKTLLGIGSIITMGLALTGWFTAQENMAKYIMQSDRYEAEQEALQDSLAVLRHDLEKFINATASSAVLHSKIAPPEGHNERRSP